MPANVPWVPVPIRRQVGRAAALFALAASVSLSANAQITVQIATLGGTGLTAGGTLQMQAMVTGTTQTSVTWSLGAPVGSISSTGLYTAPAAVPSAQTVVVTARSTADPTKFGTLTVTIYPELTITLAPGNVTLSAAQRQQFTATVTGNPDTRVTWFVMAGGSGGGTISSAGLYTAPSSITLRQTVTVMARSVANPLRTATARINLAPPASISVTINPTTATLTPTQTLALTATVTGSTTTAAVDWSMSPAIGILVPNGTTALYTAPSTVTAEQTVDIVARSAQDPTRFATTRITLRPPLVTISLTPSSATLNASQTQSLTATVTGSTNTSVSWSLSPAVGTISTSGNTAVYTAPSVLETPQTVEVVATSMALSSATAKAILTLVPVITVTMTPLTAKLKAGQSQQFTASVAGTPNKAVTWSISPAVGTISSTGVYTAPIAINTPQLIAVMATSAADPQKSAAATVQLERPDLEFSLDEYGLSTLSYQGTSFYIKPSASSNHILRGGIFRAPDKTETQIGWRTPSDAVRSSGSNWVQHTYNSGKPQQFTVRWECAVVDSRTFRVDTTIRNDDATATLAQINLLFAPLTVPTPIIGRTLHAGFMINQSDGEFVGLLNGAWGSIAIWQQLPSSGDLRSDYNDINQLEFPFTLRTHTSRIFEKYPNTKVYESPLLPGTSRSYRYFIRFGPPNATASSLAPEAFENQREVLPPTISWPDRRPIGNWFISEGSKRSAINPRGYAWNPLLNASDATQFRATMLSQANNVVAQMNAVSPRPQGLIVWDLEGQEFGHAFTYVGAPETLPVIAPEMDAIADEFFAVFRNAGYRVGITLRPMKFGAGTALPGECRAEGSNYSFSDKFIKLDATFPFRGYVCSAPNVWTQANIYDQTRTDQDEELVDILRRRISYASTRWGASIFYIDSNIWGAGGAMGHILFRRLQQEFPNVLLIPEWENQHYYGTTAPYNQANMGDLRTSDGIRQLYPDAFSVINIADGNLEDPARRAVVVEGVKNGDILLYRAWWAGPEVPIMQSIYAEAAALKAGGK